MKLFLLFGVLAAAPVLSVRPPPLSPSFTYSYEGVIERSPGVMAVINGTVSADHPRGLLRTQSSTSDLTVSHQVTNARGSWLYVQSGTGGVTCIETPPQPMAMPTFEGFEHTGTTLDTKGNLVMRFEGHDGANGVDTVYGLDAHSGVPLFVRLTDAGDSRVLLEAHTTTFQVGPIAPSVFDAPRDSGIRCKRALNFVEDYADHSIVSNPMLMGQNFAIPTV